MCLCNFDWWMVLLFNDLPVWLLLVWLPFNYDEHAHTLPGPVGKAFIVLVGLYLVSELLLVMGHKGNSAPIFGWGLVIRILIQLIVIPSLGAFLILEVIFPKPCVTFCFPLILYLSCILFVFGSIGSVYASYNVYMHYVLGLGGTVQCPDCGELSCCPVNRVGVEEGVGVVTASQPSSPGATRSSHDLRGQSSSSSSVSTAQNSGRVHFSSDMA